MSKRSFEESNDSTAPNKKEFGNEIDGEFVRRNFYIGNHEWIFPYNLNKIKKWDRTMILSDDEQSILTKKSVFRVVITGSTIRVYNRRQKYDVPQRLNFHGYVELNIRGHAYQMHQIIAFYKYGLKFYKKMSVDHLNRDRTDNTWGNLEYKNAAGQRANRSKSSRITAKRLKFDFIEADYVKVTRVPISDQVYDYVGLDLFLHKGGKHVITNKTHVRSAFNTRRYPTVNVSYKYGDVIKTFEAGLHRLIWLNFHTEISNIEHEIDHIDGNKHNWNITNLRHVTHSENSWLAHHEQQCYERLPMILIHDKTKHEFKFDSKQDASDWLFSIGYGRSSLACREEIDRATASERLVWNVFTIIK